MNDPDVVGNVLSSLSPRQPLYAVVDTARSLNLLWQVTGLGDESVSLLDSAGGALETVAPYLVRLPANSKTLQSLVCDAWGESCTVYLQSTAPLPELRAHLRRFLMVRSEEGQSYYFRYYDPRVLRAFLPTCRDAQAAVFFGPIDAFYMEGDQAAQVIEFERNVPPSNGPDVVLRKDQIVAFERAAAYQFLDRAVDELRQDWPEECARLSPETLRERVKTGMVKAGRYGIRMEDDILKYLNLSMLWSENFDASPETPWAGEILNRRDLAGSEKIHLLQYRSVRAVNAESEE
jgi:hypothetical protein